MRCLMSSASTGVRIVARALPGSGGSAARARASAACFAACRAAQGAAPRSPSLRLRPPASSLPAPALACAGFAGAPGFTEPFVTAAFFVFAISFSVRDKPMKSFGFVPVFPLPKSAACGGDSRKNAKGQLPELSCTRLHAKWHRALALRASMALLTAITDEDARGLLGAYTVGPLESVEALAAGSVNSNFSVQTAGPGHGSSSSGSTRSRTGRAPRPRPAMVERLAAAGVPTRRARAPARRRARLGGARQAGGALRLAAGEHPLHGSGDARGCARRGRALARVHLAGAREAREPSRFRFEDLCARLDRVAASGDPRFVPVVPALRDTLASAHAARAPGPAARPDPRRPVPRQRALGRRREPRGAPRLRERLATGRSPTTSW